MNALRVRARLRVPTPLDTGSQDTPARSSAGLDGWWSDLGRSSAEKETYVGSRVPMIHEATPYTQQICHAHGAQRTCHRRADAGWRLAARCAAGLLVAGLLLAGCGSPLGDPAPSAPVFRATAEGDGNVVTISTSDATTVVDVQSRSGIGAATVELVSGTPPAHMIVRLHLRVLEAFHLSYDHTVIAAAVSSNDRSIVQQVELPDGGTRPIASDSPLWLAVQIGSTQGPSTPALQPDVFEIRMPHGLLNAERRSFAMRWIDFYR